jgi:hypothetical protein
MTRKKIGRSDVIGDQGVALIHQIVSDMEFVWNPIHMEAGIDGIIEIRDPLTEEVTNNIIQVQSKATASQFTSEDENGFYYYCDERDLDYWLSGNAPVILIRSRPSTREAYWISIKDYFKDLSTRKDRKIRFDKSKNKFDITCREALIDLAKPQNSGLYLNPLPKKEKLFSNLLKAERFSDSLFLAETEFHSPKALWEKFREMNVEVGMEWILKEKRILSFHDLHDYPWSEICDQGTIEEFDTGEWAFSDDPDKEREFVWLLNRCLRQMLWPELRFHKTRKFFYVSSSENLSNIEWSYQSLKVKAGRTVFRAYRNKKDRSKVSYYRHSAFFGKFYRFGDHWYLEITPHYLFTWNGRAESYYREDLLQTIKRLERNQAVLGQVAMWADKLKGTLTLYSKPYPFLQFGNLETFEIGHGLDDRAWIPEEETDEFKIANSQLIEFPLFKDLLNQSGGGA